VPPGTRSQGGTRAEAGTRACTLEQNRHTRTLISMVEEHCTEREPHNAGAACSQLRERLN
jgi:hypothetical protein